MLIFVLPGTPLSYFLFELDFDLLCNVFAQLSLSRDQRVFGNRVDR